APAPGESGDGLLLSGVVGGVVALVGQRAGELDAGGLVTAAVGLAKLHCHVRVDPGVFRSLLGQLGPGRLAGLGGKALANLMWALATAGVQPCGSWLSGFYTAVERRLDTAGGAAAGGGGGGGGGAATPPPTPHSPSPAASSSLRTTSTSPPPPPLSGSDLATLLWSLAKLDLMPEHWLMTRLVAASCAALTHSACTADGAAVLTCLARCYCAYNWRPAEEVVGGVLGAVLPGLRRGAPGDLVALLHSAVCLSHLPARPFMLEYYSVLKDRLASEPLLSYSDFSRLLWSLSRVDCPPPRSWLREFLELSAPKLPHLRPRALSELVWVLACWDCRPSPRFLRDFFRASQRRLPEYPPAQIADTLSALAKLGCRAPSPWLAAALASFCSPTSLAEASARDLVATIESVVEVAEDRTWLAAGPQKAALQLLADRAAAKFAVFDACSHARLVLALARANCCPGPAWLRQQQASLASAWSAEAVV
ncbi:hypothetical protein Agub_g14642, partial [Astrephomene gubernaculifera]